MRRLLRLIRRHWLITGAACAVIVGLGVFTLVWFQPQKLIIDKTVNEGLPGTVSSAAPSSAPSSAPITAQAEQPGALVLLSQSALFSRGHGTAGTASIYRLPDGHRVLRFEHLRTSNGPICGCA